MAARQPAALTTSGDMSGSWLPAVADVQQKRPGRWQVALLAAAVAGVVAAIVNGTFLIASLPMLTSAQTQIAKLNYGHPIAPMDDGINPLRCDREGDRHYPYDLGSSWNEGADTVKMNGPQASYSQGDFPARRA